MSRNLVLWYSGVVAYGGDREGRSKKGSQIGGALGRIWLEFLIFLTTVFPGKLPIQEAQCGRLLG